MATKTVIVTTKRAPTRTARVARTIGAKRKKARTIDVKSVKGVGPLGRKGDVFGSGTSGTRNRGRSATSL